MISLSKLLKITFVALLFSGILVSELRAVVICTDNEKDNPNKSTILTPQKVEIVKSHTESIEIKGKDGNTLSLPKIEQKIVDQPSAVVRENQLFAEIDLSKTNKALQELLILRKEMEELSSILGVAITESSMLDLYREAADWLGTRYRRGGMSRKAVDCSGFTNIIYKNVFGQSLDRVSTTIAKNVKESIHDKEDLQPGDLVFFSTYGKKYINHVGVYLGDGKFVHASIKKGVIISRLDEGYYSRNWKKGGRN